MAETTKSTDNKKPVAEPAEALYEASALAEAAWQHFNFPPELVAVALKSADKEKVTLTEAKGIVKAFAEREVK